MSKRIDKNGFMLLFETKPILPDGFEYIDDFISVEEEQQLIPFIQTIPLHSFIFHGHEAKRRVASFGFNYSFERKSLTKGAPIPSQFDALIDKVTSTLSVPKNSFAELLITEYPLGSLINWHRDAMPYEIIAGVSLLADCQFKLRPYHRENRTRKTTITFPVKRRSLYKMSGTSRYDWEHATAPVTSVRYSITLRTVNPSWTGN